MNQAWTVLAAALRAQGDGEAASKILLPLAAAESKLWIVQFELAKTLFSQGRTQGAVAPLPRPGA